MTLPKPLPLWLCGWLIAAWLLGAALAQSALPPEARDALAKGQQAASEALATYDVHYLDRPLWREAISYGVAAVRAAPERPEPYRFLGQVYTVVKFYSRAWDAWQSYLELGGALNAQTNRYLAEVSSWLGNNSFAKGQYRQAIPYFELLARIEPQDEEANQHLALSYLALGEPQQAQPYLQTLTETYPENAGYAELQAQANEQLRYGVAASQAYRAGLAQAEAGQLADALASFRRATEANPDFRAAFVAAGRASLELSRPQEALAYWQRAVDLDPSDGQAQAALTLARNQSAYGIEAYAAYQRGVGQYAQGNAAAARTSFLAATSSNSRYGDAWGWLGRLALEAGELEQAVNYYDRARQLVPGNASYSSQYQAASAQLAQQEAERLAQEEAARQAQLEAERRAQEAAEAEAREAAQPPPEAQPPAEEATSPAATQPETQPEVAEPVVAEPAVAEPEPPAVEEAAQPETTEPETTQPEAAQAESPPPAPTQVAVRAEATPSVRSGPQLTLLEVNHTHRADNLVNGGAYSFFQAPAALSGNLEGPVDYADGTIYQRLEVLGKPSDAPVQVQLCLVPDEIVVRPACSTDSLELSQTGVYEVSEPLSDFSAYDSIDWSKGIVNVMLVLKDGEGRPLDSNYAAGEEAIDLSRYYPMAVRYEAVLVPPGGSFQGW